MTRWVCLLACLLPGFAHGQHLYRCVDYQGAVAIQDKPCPASARETKRVEATAYEETPSSRAARLAALQQANASREAGSFRPAASAARQAPSTTQPWSPDRTNSACESAKAYRERMLQILGLRRTFDDLRRLDEGVYRACKRG